MSKPSKQAHWTDNFPIEALLLSFVTGLGAQLLIDAIYVFVIPHGPHFAPELGPSGAFFVFSIMISLLYLGAFLTVVVPSFLFRARLGWSPRLLTRTLIGGCLFATSTFLLLLTVTSFSSTDIWGLTVHSIVSGACAFAVLGPR